MIIRQARAAVDSTAVLGLSVALFSGVQVWVEDLDQRGWRDDMVDLSYEGNPATECRKRSGGIHHPHLNCASGLLDLLSCQRADVRSGCQGGSEPCPCLRVAAAICLQVWSVRGGTLVVWGYLAGQGGTRAHWTMAANNNSSLLPHWVKTIRTMMWCLMRSHVSCRSACKRVRSSPDEAPREEPAR